MMEDHAPQAVPEDGDRPSGPPALRYGAATHVGNVRDNNEDSYAADTTKALWVVADGMGGLGFGEVASAISVHSVVRLVREGHGVNQAIEIAHNRIKEYAETDAQGTNMGTTLVLLLSQGSMYNVFWVGDSRAYLFGDGELKQITVDHSLVQALIEQGELTAEQARTDNRKNAVTRALGVQELDTVRADSISHRWRPGQKIILCSDGLTDFVSDADIGAILSRDGDDQELAALLIDAALAGGGRDNVTVVVVSAPDTITDGDGDTEIPGDTTGTSTRQRDDTSTPVGQVAGNVTPANNPELNSTTRIQRAARPGEPDSGGDESRATTSQPEEQSGISQRALYIIGAILLLLLIAFAALRDQDAQAGQAPASARADAAQHQLLAPRAELAFPEVAPARGPTLQVSTYATLTGAEALQTRLARSGLTPWVERPAAATNLSDQNSSQHEQLGYAVFIGPFKDADGMRAAQATLASLGLDSVVQ